MQITNFYFRDKDGNRISKVDSQDGRGPCAHFYCEVCATNFSSPDIEHVRNVAESHYLLHLPFVYVPDPEFRRMN